MPTRPILTNAQYDAGNDHLILTFDQDVLVPGDFNGDALVAEYPNEEAHHGWTINAVEDDTVTLDSGPEIIGQGLVAAPGRATAIEDLGIVGQVGGLPAYPFVNRRIAPYLVSLTITGGGTGAVLVWSEPMTRNISGVTTDITYKTPAGQGKKLNALTAGDTTNTWTITLQNVAGGPPPGVYDVVENAGFNGNTTGNPEATGAA